MWVDYRGPLKQSTIDCTGTLSGDMINIDMYRDTYVCICSMCLVFQ